MGKRSEAMQALRSRLILRALSAPTVTVAARELGIKQVTANHWIQDSDFDPWTRTVACQGCGGRMRRGGLFYWRCPTCGLEWWPPEGSAPEDPDQWLVAGVSRTNPEVAARINRMYDAGTTIREIAETLDKEGLRTAEGGRWSGGAVRNVLRRQRKKGRRRAWRETKARVLSIVSQMARDGIDAGRIAERLNAEGLRTGTGREWNRARVWSLTAKSGIKIVRGNGRNARGPTTREDLLHYLHSTTENPS